MRVGARSWCGISLAVFLCTVAGTAWSQPGTVLSHDKISNTQGGFTATLRNSDEFGGAVVSLGDLDGAGASVVAVAVGAAGDDAGGTNRGAIYVLFLDEQGGTLSYQKISDIDGNFTATLDNADEFGSSVTCLGDLDGAGPSIAAIAVGAVGDDDGGFNRGATYILFLSSSGSVLSSQKISATQGNFTAALDTADEFGGALAFLGDLDGSGPSLATLAVGVIGDDDGGTDRGAMYILSLASTGAVLSYQKVSDTQGNLGEPLADLEEFGSSVASLGDLDGSGPGVISVAVGAIGHANRSGAIYVLFLDAAGSVLSSQSISNAHGNFTGSLSDEDEFGGSTVGLGDLDGSGPSVGALAVGAGGDDGEGVDRGAIYTLFLDAGGMVLSYEQVSDTTGNFGGVLADADDFGGSLAALGDLDGKGSVAQILVVGAAGDDDGGGDRGALYLLSLEGGPTTATLLSFFDAEPLTGGIRLRWRFEQPELLEEARLERAPTVAGPWTALEVNARLDRGTMTFLDQGVTEGVSYSYRLFVRVHPGRTIVFGPLSATAGVSVRDFELAPVSPNPNHWFARVEYAVPRASMIRLSVVDIQGREVTVLAEGMDGPGRHLRAWDGTSAHGRVPAGVYFVRFETPEKTLMRRTILMQ